MGSLLTGFSPRVPNLITIYLFRCLLFKRVDETHDRSGHTYFFLLSNLIDDDWNCSENKIDRNLLKYPWGLPVLALKNKQTLAQETKTSWRLQTCCTCLNGLLVFSTNLYASSPHTSKTSTMSHLPQVPCLQHPNEPITKHCRKPSRPLRNMTVCWSPWRQASCFLLLKEHGYCCLHCNHCHHSSSDTLPPQAFPFRLLSWLSVNFSTAAKRNEARSFTAYLFRSRLLREQGHILPLSMGEDQREEAVTAEKLSL